MSGLTWIIYAADVLDNLKVALGFVVGIIVGYGVVRFCITAHNREEWRSWESVRRVVGDCPTPYWPLRPAICAACIAMAIALIPAKNTVYLMVGVEAATRMAATSEAREILGLVKDRLVSELKPAKGS